ncbi:hypothetical protein [Burkholderia sp.]|uniref:hypothetical protein n=2 Tax=Burkholderia sp. TaxID=36773 RepID=UPI00258B361B|nr:hypothetical protein [Burkholderia sp.]MCA3789059.1 hypothetical protein [Burkholderia sp.]MCA3795808.1 hypothetical protein [Burkholderia sp.]MCA3804191.1 hypothetical protein [Burkholderia sp.]MCA3836390.1 hypothetical protein [Burkholderia sp.]MCA3856874.1 hypothetical protein [Burkholderia sp.]
MDASRSDSGHVPHIATRRGYAMKSSPIAAACWVAVLGAALPVAAQEAIPRSLPLHMGVGPVIGGSADSVLRSRTVRQPDAPLTRLVVIYEDETGIRASSTDNAMARDTGDYATDGSVVVKLAPSILQTYHVAVQVRAVERDRVSTLLADNLRHDRLPVLLLRDTGAQDGFRATLKITASLADGDGTLLWTGWADASYMGMQWGARDVYAEGQRATVDTLLRKIAADLHDRRIIG